MNMIMHSGNFPFVVFGRYKLYVLFNMFNQKIYYINEKIKIKKFLMNPVTTMKWQTSL